MIDCKKRYQYTLKIKDLFPDFDGYCSCGCGKKLTGKQTKWASEECRSKAVKEFFIIKGDISVIRNELFKIDYGYCRNCGAFDDNWQADHILPVIQGGGGCSLSNFQTLCMDCHKEKTKRLYSLPNSSNIFTPSFDFFPSILYT